MGLQFRKRGKGKNSWTNYSGSGISRTTKTGNLTTNVSARGMRVTYNFGNGFRYVSSRVWNNKRTGKSLIVDIANGIVFFSTLIWIYHLVVTYIL